MLVSLDMLCICVIFFPFNLPFFPSSILIPVSPTTFLPILLHPQSVLSIQGGSLPSLAFTTSARWTRWHRSVELCTSALWHPASPLKERASSPCSSGHPSEGLYYHYWTTMTGADLSSSMTQTEVSIYIQPGIQRTVLKNQKSSIIWLHQMYSWTKNVWFCVSSGGNFHMR